MIIKQAILLIFVYTICSFTIVYSQEKLEIEGAIVIKNSEDGTPVPGTIRFNPTTNDFEGWNGLQWVSLTGFQYEIGEMMDQDGNTYPTVMIGTQEWMAKNLRTTTYYNGDDISLIGNDAVGDAAWTAANYGAYAVYDTTGTGYQSFDVNEFGNVYNWYAVNDGRGLCPTGWHVPSGDDVNSEWKTLRDFLGGLGVAGGPMKEAGTAHWNSPNQGATNSSGFTGLPGGFRLSDGSFSSLGSIAFLWSSTEAGANAWYRNLSSGFASVGEFIGVKRLGFSVRCLRD
ncbi:MAG: fibrobacter succinogenes major paralogous domain-containing protein [Saprospiraceae bacterium]|nr:fibrobacter succinogenes major paralogous domain-containing protein [Saprospiraceae bacterium]